MPSHKITTMQELRTTAASLVHQPDRLIDLLHNHLPLLVGPSVTDFAPLTGRPGTLLVIHGHNFALARLDNTVTVGGKPALVVSASATQLEVITDTATQSGPVKVTVGTNAAAAPHIFTVLPYPLLEREEDGPPLVVTGRGLGLMGDQPSTGTLRVLVALINPSDRVPADPTAARNAIVQKWADVHTFYDQASYGRLNVAVDVTASWHTLTGTAADYVDSTIDNIGDKYRVAAEAAQAAVDEGLNLSNYGLLACVMNLNGQFIRALGNWSQQNFSYTDAATGTNINITADHDISMLAIQESADWGRVAHETGHNLISAPSFANGTAGTATLGEDVYSSDLIDPTEATAQNFEIMGNHDTHPCFSAYHMDKLGWYGPANILDLPWDRNAFSQDIEVVAHGATENAAGARYHLVRIRVAEGLHYYIEVRQRPGATAQIFDASIPLDGAGHEGGVVVYKVLSDTMNNNQQMRFITLLHDAHVLKEGEAATDPARALTISVVSDSVVNRPLVCRVRVAWAQNITDDPNGAFDLRFDPWDGNYQSPDLWVDRNPFGAFDQPQDSEGRPEGNGDKPRPLEINRLWGRVHCDGVVDATNVRLTFYAANPPGVGDNGNWAPIQTKVIPLVAAGNHADVAVNWVPVVGEHTCLRVFADHQLGEITGGDNQVQENVFDFEAPAHSPATPVVLPVAVRNPLKERTVVFLTVRGVPDGFVAHFPHAWVWLNPLAERRFDLSIVPTRDAGRYMEMKRPHAQVRINGNVPHHYRETLANNLPPGSRMLGIGGVAARVTVKQGVRVTLEEDRERSKKTIIACLGAISHHIAQQPLRVDLIDPKGRGRSVACTTDAQGMFHAAFDLRLAPDGEKERDGVLAGQYRIQAFVIDAPMVAEASSNIVLVTR